MGLPGCLTLQKKDQWPWKDSSRNCPKWSIERKETGEKTGSLNPDHQYREQNQAV